MLFFTMSYSIPAFLEIMKHFLFDISALYLHSAILMVETKLKAFFLGAFCLGDLIDLFTNYYGKSLTTSYA